MKYYSWKDKKNAICILIKQISDFYGGDDINWLREYCQELIKNNSSTMDEVLFCFESLNKYPTFVIKHTYRKYPAYHPSNLNQEKTF